VIAPFSEDDETAKARRRRGLAIALALGGFVILVFVITIAKLGGHVADPHRF
jgi:hypothetical protein